MRMNGYLKVGFIILLLTFFSSISFGQRCGSDVNLIFFDKDGNVIEKEQKYEVKLISFAGNNSKNELGFMQKNYESLIYARFATLCGISEITFQVSRKGKKMFLTLKRIPMDLDYSIESPNFTEGKFEIDFEHKYDFGKFKDKTYTLKNGKSIEIRSVLNTNLWEKIESKN